MVHPKERNSIWDHVGKYLPSHYSNQYLTMLVGWDRSRRGLDSLFDVLGVEYLWLSNHAPCLGHSIASLSRPHDDFRQASTPRDDVIDRSEPATI